MSSDFPWLTALIVLPLVGAAVLWLLPAGARRHTRTVALAFTLAEVALGVGALLAFDTGDAGAHQLAETHQWIPSLGVSYAVGVDGVGLALILMSVVLVPLVVLAAWREQGSDRRPATGCGTSWRWPSCSRPSSSRCSPRGTCSSSTSCSRPCSSRSTS